MRRSLVERSHVTETSGSNVFLVDGGKIFTPRLESGILPGVTRAAVFDVAGQVNWKISEVNLLLERLLAADDFSLNSLSK